MSLFASARERRLWLWTLAVIVAIYSTLGQAGKVAETLRERNLLVAFFFLGMFLLAAAIALQWVKRRPGQAEIWVALGITGTYLMAWIRIRSWEERTHLFEYGLVAVLIFQALNERRSQGRRVPVPAGLAVVVTTLLGLLDEGIQAMLPDRIYDMRDVGFNALAGLMATAASLALGWARRRLDWRGRGHTRGRRGPAG